MPVFILLSDGTVGEIELSEIDYQPQIDPWPIQLVPSEGYSFEIIDSFKLAGLTAYNILKENRLDAKSLGLAYRIKNLSGKGLAPKLVGESGGLGFCLALLINILKNKKDELNVAATGVISNLADGKLAPIDYLVKKLRGGIQSLPNGTSIYYPSENQIDEADLKSLKELADSKKIALKPVANVEEAAKDFLPPLQVHQRWKKLILPICALLFAYFAYFFSSYPAAVYLLEAGKYDLAEFHLDVGTRLFPWSQRLDNLNQELKQQVKANVRLRYSLQIGVDGHYEISKIPNDWSLNSTDGYAFQIASTSQVYLYLFELDSAGEIRPLFPSSLDSSITNPLAANKTHDFPGKGILLYPRGYPGVIKIYCVISKWRCKDLEAALYTGKENRAPRVQKSDLELMISSRDRGGLGALVEQAAYWKR